jgi:bacterioferritin-associated ferredoxin
MNKEETVCFCFNVTVGDIEEAINAGAKTVDEVMNATNAGQGCGSCIEKIESIVEELTK